MNEELGQVVVLCLLSQSPWSVFQEAKDGAKRMGGVLDSSVPCKVEREGIVNGIDLAANGYKTVTYTMKRPK